jgi:hypothetical protein
VLHNRATGDYLWFGIYNSAGTKQLVYRRALAGPPAGAVVVLVANAGAGPYWLRIATSQARAFVDDGSLTLSYSTTSATAGFTDIPINTGITTGWRWAGFALYSNVAAPTTSTTVAFDDFLLHPADSLRPFYWYAFRDPALSGNPDMVGAHLLVQKIKPAYTHAAAIASPSCICDDPLNGLCDRAPCA